MKRLVQFSLFGLSLILGATTAAQSPDPLVERLDPATLSPAWETILSGLRAAETVQADFEERRFFGFRAKPVALRGRLRMDRARGLSLQYTHPEPYTIIVDDGGVLVRDEFGRERAAPAQAVEATTRLREVLHLDLQRLSPHFLIRGRLEPPVWSLALEPLRPKDPVIELSGSDHQVRKLSLSPTPRRRIDLTLTNIVSGAVISPADVRRYFR